MIGRPSRLVLASEVGALVAAVVAAVLLAGEGDWDLPLLAMLLTLAVVSDVRAVEITAHRVKASGSFLAIVAAIVLLGATPAAIIGIATIAASWVYSRYAAPDLLINLVTYAWFPLLAGAA